MKIMDYVVHDTKSTFTTWSLKTYNHGTRTYTIYNN